MQDNAENLLPHSGNMHYYPSFFDIEVSDNSFQTLLREIDWRSDEITIFGKTVLQPRLTAWYGDVAYTYSGITMQPQPWTDTVTTIKNNVEKELGVNFNSVLLNLYRDGKDYMGWHRDNEKELGIEPVIASVSFGATRTFRVRNYASKKENVDIELQPGSLVVMSGDMQEYWEHMLPKRLKVSEPRINLTFRTIRS